MGSIFKVALGFIPGVGPILSCLTWKTVAWVVGAIVAAVVLWKAYSFVEQAQADHAAVATLTAQRDAAIVTANANAAALSVEQAQRAALATEQAKTKAAISANDAAVRKQLKGYRNAPLAQGCHPAPADVAVFDSLRQ